MGSSAPISRLSRVAIGAFSTQICRIDEDRLRDRKSVIDAAMERIVCRGRRMRLTFLLAFCALPAQGGMGSRGAVHAFDMEVEVEARPDPRLGPQPGRGGSGVSGAGGERCSVSPQVRGGAVKLSSIAL